MRTKPATKFDKEDQAEIKRTGKPPSAREEAREAAAGKKKPGARKGA
jgi:hypothetical protein